RRRGQLSLTGAVLDPYATFIGAISLQVGLGFYCAHKSGINAFYYLTAMIPFCYAMKITGFAYDFILQEQVKSEKLREYIHKRLPDEVKNTNEQKRRISRYHSLIANFLDDRARTTDFICLLVIMETFSGFFVTWLIFLGFVLKALLVFAASLYVVAKGGWVEKKIDDKISEIVAAFNPKR
nr:hypothetical protein [Candidatus Omnitrophota bacterium]